MLMDQILVSALYTDGPLNPSEMPCFSFPSLFLIFVLFFFFFHPAIILPNMLCSTHLGMQIGKKDMQKKKTREKEVRVLTTSTVNSFQPCPTGLDLSGTLSLANVCETHVKCVSVQPYRQNLDFPSNLPLNSCLSETNPQ